MKRAIKDPISQAQQVGFAVTITGVLLWSRLKLQEQEREAPERLPLHKARSREDPKRAKR